MNVNADDDGPTVEEAKAAAKDLKHEDDPANADLPTDVKDGEAGAATSEPDADG